MKHTVIETFLAYMLGIIIWFLGGIDEPLKILLGCAVIDYLSGVSVAFSECKLNSRIGFRGILKKCVMFSLVGISNLIGGLISGGEAVRTIVILFYIGNEGLSIMENAFKLGVPFPKALRDKFEQFRDEDKDAAPKGGERDGDDSNRKDSNDLSEQREQVRRYTTV